MKLNPTCTLLILALTPVMLLAEGVGIASNSITPDASAILDVRSESQGALFPRMTTAQMNAIGAPAEGLLVYNTTQDAFYFRASGAWQKIGSDWSSNGTNLYTLKTPVGINTSTPIEGRQFHIMGTTTLVR